MNNEHNPIAQLVSQIQQKWNSDVTPHAHLKLVRWLIKPDQARLYEGFLRLESTQHGSIPDMTIVLLTAFKNIKNHSEHLIKEWIAAYKKDKDLVEAFAQSNNDFKWDVDAYESQIKEDDEPHNDTLLLDLLKTFQGALPDKKRTVTLCFFPYTVDDIKNYSKWLHNILKLEMPDATRLMIFDYADERHFDTLCKMHEPIVKSLSIPLDLDGAMNKLATSGDPNDPEVQFRHCMIKMSKSVSDKNLKNLNRWGEKGLEVTQKTGNKNNYAAAHIIYAGMLFNFKEYTLIDDLLQKGLAIAKQGLQAKDDTCKPLIVQYYGYQASSKQLQKEKDKAIALFCKQADTAIAYGFKEQPLMAWWMAYSMAKKKKDQYKKMVTNAYTYGIALEKETLKSTCMAYIAADYYNLLEKENNKSACKNVDAFMVNLEGEHWRDNVEAQRKEMEKKKLSILNWF